MAGFAGRPPYATQHVGPVNHHDPLVRAVERTSARAGRPVHLAAGPAGGLLQPDGPRAPAGARRPAGPHRCDSAIGVDTTAFCPGPAERRCPAACPSWGCRRGKPLALFVGRLVPKKGYQHLVRAAGDSYHIVLAGSGRPAEPLPPGVTFLGPVPRERLIDLYRLAHVFVLPSHRRDLPDRRPGGDGVWPAGRAHRRSALRPVRRWTGRCCGWWSPLRPGCARPSPTSSASRRSGPRWVPTHDVSPRPTSMRQLGEADLATLYDEPRENLLWTSPSSS